MNDKKKIIIIACLVAGLIFGAFLIISGYKKPHLLKYQNIDLAVLTVNMIILIVMVALHKNLLIMKKEIIKLF